MSGAWYEFVTNQCVCELTSVQLITQLMKRTPVFNHVPQLCEETSTHQDLQALGDFSSDCNPGCD